MRYISIDIETTGLDPENNDILSIGAIVENTVDSTTFEDIPKFHVAILNDQIKGSPFAINMNRDLISSISKYQNAKTVEEKIELEKTTGMKFLQKDQVMESFFHFLFDNGFVRYDNWVSKTVKVIDGKTYPMITSGMKPIKIIVAGKNYGTFDKLFLERMPRWKQIIRAGQRILDPAILFVDWNIDENLPSLGECKKRAGVSGAVTHNALEDAWDVIQVLRTKYNN